MEYVLVLYVYAGMLSKGDSVALTRIDTYQTAEACREAAMVAEPLVKGTFKELRYACIPHQK